MKAISYPSARTVLALLAGWAVLTGCGQVTSSAQASASSQSSPTTAVQTSDGPIELEFEVPPEFRTRPEGSANAVTGFRVGFFRGKDMTSVTTVDVTRDALTLRNGTARVTVPRDRVGDCGADCVIRVQTLSGRETSAWSGPVAVAGIAETRSATTAQKPQQQAKTPARPRNALGQRRQAGQQGGLAPADIKQYGSITELLQKMLPPDANLEDELRRFRQVDELAVALAISRNYDIPFTSLSRMIEGPPRLRPVDALEKLRPDLDSRAAIRKSRTDARKLIR